MKDWEKAGKDCQRLEHKRRRNRKKSQRWRRAMQRSLDSEEEYELYVETQEASRAIQTRWETIKATGKKDTFWLQHVEGRRENNQLEYKPTTELP